MAVPITDFVYTVQETAELLKLSERTIHRYINKGKLRAYRIAGERKLRIKGEDLLALLEPVEQIEVVARSDRSKTNAIIDTQSEVEQP